MRAKHSIYWGCVDCVQCINLGHNRNCYRINRVSDKNFQETLAKIMTLHCSFTGDDDAIVDVVAVSV